jgi:hypothetical protein
LGRERALASQQRTSERAVFSTGDGAKAHLVEPL